MQGFDPDVAPIGWPSDWSLAHWKPSTDIERNLVKAGALIVAELDRLARIPDECPE